MIRLPKRETKLLVAIHGWSGILLGLLLYAVVITGMAAVFAQEIGIWSAGHVETRSAFQRQIDPTIRRIAAITPAKYHEGVDLFEIGDHDLGAFFHHHELDAGGRPISRGVYYQFDHGGNVVSRHEGSGEEVFGPRNDDALRSFLVDTHVRLHIPNPWGLVVTGVLGLSMLVAAISGLLIHRHLLKDIFTLRRRANPVLVDRDRHSVAGSWSLPFAFILAFTGSFFSFFGTVGVPIVAMAAFAGDQEALSEAVFGNPAKPDPKPEAMGNLDRIVADAIGRAGGIPTFISIENFGRADAAVTTFHEPAPGDVEPTTLVYRGATAAFVKVKPLYGTKPSAGGTAAAIMGPLHFGNFAGLLSKAVWFGLGFAMCYVTLTGLRLWLVRRRDKSLAWLDRSVSVAGFGLPFALVMSAVGFLIAMPRGVAVYWTPAAFLIAAGAAAICGLAISSARRIDMILQTATGGLLLVLPVIRLATGGPGWAAALAGGQPLIMAVDLAVVLGGGWMLWLHRGHVGARSELHRLQPAE